jgi:hypothetical protein
LEAAQKKFLRPMLGFKRLDNQMNKDTRKIMRVQNIEKHKSEYKESLKKKETCRQFRKTDYQC